MTYTELNQRIENINDEGIVQTMKEIVNTCITNKMSADDTYQYLIDSLKGMK